jgi:hypothetical protein
VTTNGSSKRADRCWLGEHCREKAGIPNTTSIRGPALADEPPHLPGSPIIIATYCDHPVRFGVVESINTTIKAVLRRARGMRDERMLLLN